MNIYCMGLDEASFNTSEIQPRPVDFAFFSAFGTWVGDRPACDLCGWHWQSKTPPLLLQWQSSTTTIGDFSWDGPFGYTFVVKERIAAALTDMGFDCRFERVQIIKPDQKKYTVPFPYAGPELLWVRCENTIDLDMTASGVEQLSECASCGDVRHTFKYEGITIRRGNWRGEKMFRIRTNGRSAATFVTEEGRTLLLDRGFTNTRFRMAGEIVG